MLKGIQDQLILLVDLSKEVARRSACIIAVHYLCHFALACSGLFTLLKILADLY